MEPTKQINQVLKLLSLELNKGDVIKNRDILVDVAKEIDILLKAKQILKRYETDNH
jgi:hypothetical protein